MSPLWFASAEADSGNRYPFGESRTNDTTFRYQQVHDDVAMGRIAELAFRRDLDFAQFPSGMSPSYELSVEVVLSHAKRDSHTTSLRFDDNHGNDRVVALPRTSIQFPTTWPGRTPAPFDYRIKLAQPFAWDGAGSLCWECRVHATSAPKTINFDSVRFARSNPELALQSFGPTCRRGVNARDFVLAGNSQMNWPKQLGSLQLEMREAPGGTPVLVMLGFDDRRLGPVELPQLMAGTTNAPSGPCWLMVAPDLLLITTSDASGDATIDWPTLAVPNAHGLQLFFQAIAPAPGANVYDLILSNGLAVNWVAPYPRQPVTRVYAMDADAASGIATPGAGLITRFDG